MQPGSYLEHHLRRLNLRTNKRDIGPIGKNAKAGQQLFHGTTSG